MIERMRGAWIPSLVCSAVYLATVHTGGFSGRWIVKALAVALLAFSARRHAPLAGGLLCGAVGDALLGLSSGLFVHGMAAFLCGHIAYIGYFLRTGSRRVPLAAALAVSAWFIALFGLLQPGLGRLQMPVLLYTGALAAMMIASFRMGGWVTVGALLFGFSDSVLGINRFRAHLPHAAYLVWGTYYGGQFLLAWGRSRSERGPA